MIGRDEAEELLRLLSPERPKMQPKSKKALSTQKRVQDVAAAESAPASAAPSSSFTNPLFLDGSTIRAAWKKGRQLVGKVVFNSNVSRQRIGKRRGMTKYRIFFEGRKPEGVRVSWNRLKSHKYEVIASSKHGHKSKAWSDAEEKALLRRHRAHESGRSLACGLGRTLSEVSSKIERLINKKRKLAKHGQSGQVKDTSIGWRKVSYHRIVRDDEETDALRPRRKRMISDANVDESDSELVTEGFGATDEAVPSRDALPSNDGDGAPPVQVLLHTRKAAKTVRENRCPFFMR